MKKNLEEIYNMSPADLITEFTEGLTKASSYNGEPSYGYQVGFLLAILANLARYPEVRNEIEREVWRFRDLEKQELI
jgi:hypothetical protein